jgi:hypothetical protein
MRGSIKIIKRGQSEAQKDLTTSGGEKSVEKSTRDMASTVKSWIAELQQRKRSQVYSFPSLPVIASDPAGPNG